MTVNKYSAALIEEWFEDDNWVELGVNKTSVMKNIRALVPWDGIIDARFFPQFDSDNVLDRVHLLFITKNIIHHVFLGRSQVVFSEYPVSNISIKLKFIYTESRKEDSLIMNFDIGEVREDGKPWLHYFIAPAKLRGHAISLVSLINALKEGSLYYENTED